MIEDEYQRSYYRKNREKILAKRRAAYAADPARFVAQVKARGTTAQERQERGERHRRKRRLRVIQGYGGRCSCCGESHFEFLALDHVANDGKTHRDETGHRGYAMVKWAERNGLPDRLRVLCHNCNSAMAYYGYCPHEAIASLVGEGG